MLRSVLTCAAAIIVATAALAQPDPISTRRNIMKGVGAATKAGTQMIKGETPFDLAKAQEILTTYANAAGDFHIHFPASTKTGGDTTASPKIWENQAEFRASFDTWAKDIKAAADSTKDLTSFQAAFGNVTKACKACHETYRIKT